MNAFVYSIGILGQVFFSGRFLIQWIASERANASVIPLSFWFFSILGSLLLLIYAILRKDPIFVAGQSMGLVIYLRNLHLLKKKKMAG